METLRGFPSTPFSSARDARTVRVAGHRAGAFGRVVGLLDGETGTAAAGLAGAIAGGVAADTPSVQKPDKHWVPALQSWPLARLGGDTVPHARRRCRWCRWHSTSGSVRLRVTLAKSRWRSAGPAARACAGVGAADAVGAEAGGALRARRAQGPLRQVADAPVDTRRAAAIDGIGGAVRRGIDARIGLDSRIGVKAAVRAGIGACVEHGVGDRLESISSTASAAVSGGSSLAASVAASSPEMIVGRSTGLSLFVATSGTRSPPRSSGALASPGTAGASPAPSATPTSTELASGPGSDPRAARSATSSLPAPTRSPIPSAAPRPRENCRNPSYRTKANAARSESSRPRNAPAHRRIPVAQFGAPPSGRPSTSPRCYPSGGRSRPLSGPGRPLPGEEIVRNIRSPGQRMLLQRRGPFPKLNHIFSLGKRRDSAPASFRQVQPPA